MKKIKWGIIGCGNIANKFASDLALVKNAELIGVASRSQDKAVVFGRTHSVKKAYDSYDKLLNNGEIDIVYIATPHTSHAALSIKAMKMGKHVLCEKPLALNRNETQNILKTSNATSRFFMEALWTRFNPTFIEVLHKIRQGELGTIKYLNAEFSFKSDKPLGSRVLDVNLGGGAILDIGIYPVFLAYMILGKPTKIMATSLFHEDTKCDVQTSMIFEYENAQAMLYSSFASKTEISANVSGTEARIQIKEPWHAAENYSVYKDERSIDFNHKLTGMGYYYEILECHKCIADNKIESELWSHQNSLDLISILDEIRKIVGLKYPQEP
jgi:predicted dehydrogenase